MQQWLNIPYDNHDLHGPETGISRVVITYPNDPLYWEKYDSPKCWVANFHALFITGYYNVDIFRVHANSS